MKKFIYILYLIGGLLIFAAIAGYILNQVDHVLVLSGAKLPPVDGPVALGLIVVSIVFLLPAYLLQRRDKAKNPGPEPEIKLDINDLGFIKRSIKKTARRNLWVGIFLIAFAAFMLWLQFATTEAVEGWKAGVLIGFASLFLVVGLLVFYQYTKVRNVTESKIYKLLMLEPQTITGLHVTIYSKGGSKFARAVNAGVIVGKKVVYTLAVSETELELLPAKTQSIS